MPDLSVVIPFKDDFSNLKLCLDSLKKQKSRYNYEILVIDDGSSERYEKNIVPLGLKKVRYFYQKNKGPAAARNAGIKRAKAKIIALLDSDCIPNEKWVENIIDSYKKNKSFQIIGGKVEVKKDNLYALASQYLTSNAMYDTVNGKKELIFMPTCNLAIKKEVFKKIGYFDEDFKLPAGEDLEFCWRAFKKRRRLVYKEDISVFHNLGDSLGSYVKQAYRYGKGNYMARIKQPDHPEIKSIRLGSKLNFYFGCLVDLIDGPRFAFVFTQRVNPSGFLTSVSFFLIFLLHKIFYVMGNIKATWK